MRIPYEQINKRLKEILVKYGFSEERAALCAMLFAESSLDGVYSHGLNRFPRFIQYIKDGIVDVSATPVLTEKIGMIERWDGCRGPGNLNAHACMSRAIAVAKQNAMGVVALKNTNHWMRPGAYGLMAAEENCIGILWTNTIPNLPPWGSVERKLGNNPIVFAIPNEGGHLLLDAAMSMFSYGKMETSAMRGELLPVDGGYDENGELTRDPKAILQSGQPLPIGYWKGSGLSLMLDLIAASLSGGLTTYQVGRQIDEETCLSQVFMAIDMNSFPDSEQMKQSIMQSVSDITSAEPREGQRVRCPGGGRLAVRSENERLGIPVDMEIWESVLKM